jgi:hypothetical protein
MTDKKPTADGRPPSAAKAKNQRRRKMEKAKEKQRKKEYGKRNDF